MQTETLDTHFVLFTHERAELVGVSYQHHIQYSRLSVGKRALTVVRKLFARLSLC